MPAPSFGLSPQLAPKRLGASQVADVAGVGRMCDFDRFFGIWVEGGSPLNFEKAATLQLFPLFAANIDHAPVHRSSQALVRLHHGLSGYPWLDGCIGLLDFFFFHFLQSFSPLLGQSPNTVFRYFDLG